MDKLPIATSRALNRARKVNDEINNHSGKFSFDLGETQKRSDGFGVITMAETELYHAVPFDLIVCETLILCHMIHTRSFEAGNQFGRWMKQAEFLSVLGLPVAEVPE